MNCKQLTTSINIIKSKKVNFDDELSSGNIGTTLTLQKELESSITEIKRRLKVSVKQAKELMDNEMTLDEKEKGMTNVFGPEEVKRAFGIEIPESEIPPIPFSKEELERAKELGQMLVLRVGTTSDGIPLTMKKIGEILDGKVKDDGKVFYPTEWYKDEKFFTDDAIETGWALVSKGLVPDSVNKNYFDQIGLLIEQLNKSFGGAEKLPEDYAEAVKEYVFAMDEIAGLIDTNRPRAAEKLEGLKINQLLRQSPAETVYDLILYFQNTGERLLDDKYTWTKRRDSGGGLVYVGSFGSAGVSVGGSGPGDSSGGLGGSFSRSR